MFAQGENKIRFHTHIDTRAILRLSHWFGTLDSFHQEILNFNLLQVHFQVIM